MKRLTSFLAALLLAPASAFCFAHTWYIQEIYSNASGSVQFVEFFGNTLNGEDFLNGQTLNFLVNGVTQNTMTFSNATATDGTGDLSGPTLNKTVLIGTANLATLYGVTPDYIIPGNFLATGALNRIVFSASGDQVNLTNLPTNGSSSLDGLVNNFGTTAADTAIQTFATPKNFAGQTATIPEPATIGSVGFGAATLAGLIFLRRRRA
jgi:serralysin